MTRQKRTHLFILALVPAVVFAAVRCADSTATAPLAATPAALTADGQAKLAKLHSETDWVGQFHNDALNFVFASLKRLPAKSRDRHAVCEAARMAYAEFHKSRRGVAVPASVDDAFELFCAGGGASGSALSLSIAIPSGAPRADISPAAQNFMDQIDAAVPVSVSYEDLSSRVNSIESSASANLSYDEAAAVFTVGSVALNSAEYWVNNITAWVPLTNTADYSVLLSSRNVPFGFDDGTLMRRTKDDEGWSGFFRQVWSDTKAAAKRAVGGDVKGAARAVMAAGLAGSPVIYEIVLGGAATGSIMAVLQM